MHGYQRTARIAGVWFAITFIASIPALLLYSPVLHHHDYILGAGADKRIALTLRPERAYGLIAG